MRAVVQRVREARVTIDGAVVGAIDRGLCVPSGSNLSESDRERVISAIRAVFDRV